MTNEQYTILVEELHNDPLGIGYSELSDEDVAKKLNEQAYSVPTTRFSLTNFATIRLASAMLT